MRRNGPGEEGFEDGRWEASLDCLPTYADFQIVRNKTNKQGEDGSEDVLM